MNILDTINKYIVVFGFDKTTDGSYRPARGTRNINLIPKTGIPNGNGIPDVPGLIRYYDFNKRNWRSFYINKVKWFYPVDSLGNPI